MCIVWLTCSAFFNNYVISWLHDLEECCCSATSAAFRLPMTTRHYRVARCPVFNRTVLYFGSFSGIKVIVKGPLLYLLYTADIGPLLTRLGLLHHLFADDVQVYVYTDPLAAETVITQMSQAIDVLTSWMAANRLLNPFKTQAIWLGGHRPLAKIDGQRLSSLFPHITFSTCVRDLGAMLDSELTFSHHINLIARKCYYQLRQLRVVFRSLTHQSRLTLVHAFVTSRIDCCCSLLAGLPLGTLARLDRVLRSAARLVGGLSKFSSITAYMREILHWLPISERIQYR